jgi:hypothetical protein
MCPPDAANTPHQRPHAPGVAPPPPIAKAAAAAVQSQPRLAMAYPELPPAPAPPLHTPQAQSLSSVDDEFVAAGGLWVGGTQDGRPRPGALPSSLPEAPSALWNGMLAPLRGLAVRAALWTGGEREAEADVPAGDYACALRAFVAGLREEWARQRLPFV